MAITPHPVPDSVRTPSVRAIAAPNRSPAAPAPCDSEDRVSRCAARPSRCTSTAPREALYRGAPATTSFGESVQPVAAAAGAAGSTSAATPATAAATDSVSGRREERTETIGHLSDGGAAGRSEL